MNRAIQSREDTIIAGEKEQIAMAWNALILDKTMGNAENINKDNFGLELKKLENKTVVKYVDDDENKNFLVNFTNTHNEYVVDKKGNILNQRENMIEIEDEEFNEKQILQYDIASSRTSEIIKDTTILYDLSGNGNNAVLHNINLDSSEQAILFNGQSSSSYAKLDLKSQLEFPLTVEMTIACSQSLSSAVIYADPVSKTSFGCYSGNFICITNSNTKANTFSIPNNFFDGTLKHIVIEYTDLFNAKVYVNGEQCSKNSSTNSWDWGSSSTNAYLGKRESGTYFKGLLYDFRIYNRLFTESEYSSTNNRSNLVVEYNISNENSFKNLNIINELIDLKNNNNAICYNVAVNSENGIIFNGTSSYLELGLKSPLEFPLTIEMTIACPQNLSSAVIYADPVSKTAFGYYNEKFICITNSNTNAKTFVIPSNFFDGTLKHIVIEYTDVFNADVYVNGEKCTKQSNTDNWDWNSSSTKAYIGRRQSGTYFQGTLYNFNIYNSLLEEDKILEKYHNLNI